MKTRFLFTLLSAVLCSVSVFAQDDFITVDWKELKSTVARNPQEVTDKVGIVLALDPDSSLPFEDMVVAFYGQSLLTNDREEPYVREMFELYSEKKYPEALAKAQEVLDINPLNIDALYASSTLLEQIPDSAAVTVTSVSSQDYLFRAFVLLCTISVTGDGSAEHPFCVTKVKDEYNFMRHYLDLWEYEGQSLVGFCDVFQLGESSKWYSADEIYFDAYRPLEITAERLGE